LLKQRPQQKLTGSLSVDNKLILLSGHTLMEALASHLDLGSISKFTFAHVDFEWTVWYVFAIPEDVDEMLTSLSGGKRDSCGRKLGVEFLNWTNYANLLLK
jgi:hypothetical protein